jgi:hypothetical protein
MKLFTGLDRTDYQDLMRTIGAWIDERGWREIRFWEHADGLIVQGRPQPEAGYETILMTDDDLRDLLRAAYDRRGLPTPTWLNSPVSTT